MYLVHFFIFYRENDRSDGSRSASNDLNGSNGANG